MYILHLALKMKSPSPFSKHYKDRKGEVKHKKLGSLRQLRSLKVINNITIR